MSLYSKKFAAVVMTLFLTSCHALLPDKKFFKATRITTQPRYSLSVLSAATVAPEKPVTKEKVAVPVTKEVNKSINLNDLSGDGELWEIRILDNDYHFDYQVAEILVKVANLSEIQAFSAMRTAEKHGSCSIGEYDHEMAEHYTSALLDHHLGCEMNPLGFM
ncbi:MAG: hypothetical protein SGBAC_010577 [Bacillariaceae sp.]